MAVCAETIPPGVDVAAGHRSACWLHASDLSAAQDAPITPNSSAPAPGEETR
jgi:hypothetical protein